MNDSWFGVDKLLHLTVCFLLAGVGTCALVAGGMRLLNACFLAFCMTVIVGALKEVLDAMGSGDTSLKDLVADAVGAALGTGLAAGILSGL